MKKFLLGLVATIFLLTGGAIYTFSHSAPTVSPDSGDIRDIDNMTPGSYKVSLGTRLRGQLQTGTTTSAACTTSVSACNTVATTESTAVTLKTTGSAWGESFALADGYPNQVKTYVLVTDGGKNLRISPTTKTGFTYLELDDAKDSVSIKWADTTGWFVTGNNGATVN